jgi:AraC-like DNA-binding protein
MKQSENKAENTTLSTIPRLLAQVLSIYEVDSDSLFTSAGLDLHQLQTNDVRVPMEKMSELWKLAVDATDNNELGLICASLFQPAYIKGLGLAWMASENIIEGLKLFIKNSQLVNTAAQIELETNDKEIIIKYKNAGNLDNEIKVHPCAIQLGVGFFLKMFRLAAGKTIPATGVYFSLSIKEQLAVYEEHFECPIYDNHDFNGIAFSTSLLTELLPTHDADLVDVNKTAVEKYLSSLSQGDIGAQVSEALTKLLPTGCPTEEEIAYRLHMSKRTLQRKLKAEGPSYSTLLMNIRSDLAKHYLSHTKSSMTEIAYQLGYSSPSTFARAFKQQFGNSPLEYRTAH